MPNEEALEVVKQLAERFRRSNEPVEGLLLYGSMARGDDREWSDIDVMALIDDSVSKSALLKLRGRLQYLASELDTRLEILAIYAADFENDQSIPIIDIARNEGIRVAA